MRKSIFILAATALLVVAAFGPATAGKAENTLNGGGQIVQDDYKISFGGNVKENGALSGQLQVNFHDVSNADVTGGKFHSTAGSAALWYESNSATCEAAVSVIFDGRFDGEDGYSLRLQAGDNDDTVRIRLFDAPGGADVDVVYDTYWGDFPGESSCVGSARHGLDRGNLKIRLAD